MIQTDSCTFESFKVIQEKPILEMLRAIQGHSGGTLVDPALHHNVLLPKEFTRYVYHIGSGKELKSTVNNGLTPGGFSTKMGRQAVCFTVVNRKDDKQGLWETFLRFIKSKNRALQKYLETISGYSKLVQLIARSRERVAILPNKV